MLFNSRTETMIPCELDWCQPELRLLLVASHVNVHGLPAIEAVEEGCSPI
jgi:hypothetical protein